MIHKHHSIPQSRGGVDEEWNLVEVDPYSHAYEHAVDFVLFESAPRFDFRHEAWPLLPEDLKEAVRGEASRRQTNRDVSPTTREKMRQAALSRELPWAGKENLSLEHRQKIAEALKGKEKSPQHVENFKAAVKGRKAPNEGVPHSEETRRKISEAKKGSTPWNKGLSKNGK
jgi:hypothetical protein